MDVIPVKSGAYFLREKKAGPERLGYHWIARFGAIQTRVQRLEKYKRPKPLSAVEIRLSATQSNLSAYTWLQGESIPDLNFVRFSYFSVGIESISAS